MRLIAGRPLVAWLVPCALLVYAGASLVVGRWLAALAAAVVATLLWRRHRRARFAAYVLFTAMAMRGIVQGAWPALAFAVAAIAVLQIPSARATWPRLRPDLGGAWSIRAVRGIVRRARRA
jgi:hypothetical protein